MENEFEFGKLPHNEGTRREQRSNEAGNKSAQLPRLLPLQQAGNQAVEELLRSGSARKLTARSPGSTEETEANKIADRAIAVADPRPGPASTVETSRQVDTPPGAAAAPTPAARFLRSPGHSLEPHTRRLMEGRLWQDLSRVHIHTDAEATESAHALGARAYTVGEHIAFDSKHFNPETTDGQRLLAHELAHVLHPPGTSSEIQVRRETAAEVEKAYETNWLLFTSVDEKGLAARLITIVGAGQYAFAADVLRAVPSTDQDDVVGYMMPKLTIKDLISINKKPGGGGLLTLMKDAVGTGWVSADEYNAAELLGAVLGPGPARNKLNRRRIETLKKSAPTDLEALANMFEDDQIIDDDTVSGRLQSILGATQHVVIPGLQTGVDFKDTGFRGEPTPTGSGFRDPHPSSANQVGHFLTAVGLEFSPEVVSRPLFAFPSVREMVEAPPAMSDAEVGLRLTIGHEKAPDPNGALDVALQTGAVWLIESMKSGPEGETEEQKEKRVDEAVANEIQRQVRDIIAAFRKQFKACTDADVAAWNEALASFRKDEGGLERPGNALDRIAVDPSMKGNSRQDLRLSLVGWRLGEKIRNGDFADPKAVAAWIRKNLGTPAAP